MGLFEYEGSKRIAAEVSHLTAGNEFYSCLMATIRLAGSLELEKLEIVFPETVAELRAHYNAPGGILPADRKSPYA